MIEILIKYYPALLNGLKVTFFLCLHVWIIGIIGGCLIAFLDSFLFNRKFKLGLSNLFSIVILGIPILILLYWINYPFQSIFNIDIEPFYVAVIALSILNVAMVANVINEAISNIPDSIIDLSRYCGISKLEDFFLIKIPLILRQSMGSIVLVQLSMLHNSIFSSLVNVQDILWQAKNINSIEHKPIEVFSTLVIFFLLVSIPIILLGNFLKEKFAYNYSV